MKKTEQKEKATDSDAFSFQKATHYKILRMDNFQRPFPVSFPSKARFWSAAVYQAFEGLLHLHGPHFLQILY